nr:uncharacterized protein CTRU02_08160 [Colletotrichum truncatum]KAF6790640.1 secreted protein [Colletotrichum truncatum]
MVSATFLGFVASAAAAALSVRSEPPQPLGELGWEGAVTPNRPVLEVWGTSFEDIESKIRKDYPNFSIYTEEEQVDPETSANPAVATRGELERRWVSRLFNKREKYYPFCPVLLGHSTTNRAYMNLLGTSHLRHAIRTGYSLLCRHCCWQLKKN